MGTPVRHPDRLAPCRYRLGERLGDVEETYIALVAAITRFQPVLICVADDDLQTYAEARLRSARIDLSRVRFVPAEYDDTWLRDSGRSR
jgi:agmatine/peptidylarginine deiminase